MRVQHKEIPLLVLAAGLTAVALMASPSAHAQQWVKFRDPTEGAFTIDVPKGWKGNGGLQRRSINQPHPFMLLVSPDELTVIRMGDPNAIAYADLTRTLTATGFREGSAYTPRGEPMRMLRWHTGEEMARELGQQELAATQCTGIKVVESRSLPVQTQHLPQPPGTEVRDTAGEAEFTCTRNQILYAAYVFSETDGQYFYANGQVVSGTWGDDRTVTVIAPQGTGKEAQAIAAHVVQSIQFDPQWYQRQFRIAFDAAQAMFGGAMTTLGQQSASWDRTIRGVENYSNPQTGKTLEVPITGAANYAQKGDTIIGLTGNEAPAGYTLLNKLPR